MTVAMPLVTHILGESSADGSRIIRRFIVGEAHETEVGLSGDDAQPLAAFLIALSGEALHRDGVRQESDTRRVRPFPVSAATIAEGQDRAPVLVLKVGATVPGFALHPSQMERLGRAVLMLSAPGGAPAH